MRVLITGSAGFVGSHLVDHLLQNTDWDIIGIDSFKHRGDAIRVVDNSRYKIICSDLSAPISARIMGQIGDVDYVINMASESHVDRSIEDPVSFIQNNVNLALHVFEACRVWKPKHIVQISTDEVYGPAPEGKDHTEWSEILPSNPYSASKASQEAIAISYWRTYGLPITITNTMNMIGERQDPEKYVPKIISAVVNGKLLTVHGNRSYIGKRHYLHARNHADALLYLLENTEPSLYTDSSNEGFGLYGYNEIVPKPSRYNIVGDVELNNLEIAKWVAEFVGKPLNFELVDFHAMTTRPGHDRRYSLCGKKLRDLGWNAPVSLYQSLENTVKWYLDNPHWLR